MSFFEFKASSIGEDHCAYFGNWIDSYEDYLANEEYWLKQSE